MEQAGGGILNITMQAYVGLRDGIFISEDIC